MKPVLRVIFRATIIHLTLLTRLLPPFNLKLLPSLTTCKYIYICVSKFNFHIIYIVAISGVQMLDISTSCLDKVCYGMYNL